MIRRSSDPAEVNPLVARDFAGLDFTDFLAEPMHVCLLDGDSGALFAWRGPGTYELHVFFAVRGRDAIDLGHAMLDWMRRECGARRFWALVPEDDRKVKLYTRLMGWRSLGSRQTRNGPNELFALEDDLCRQQ